MDEIRKGDLVKYVTFEGKDMFCIVKQITGRNPNKYAWGTWAPSIKEAIFLSKENYSSYLNIRKIIKIKRNSNIVI